MKVLITGKNGQVGRELLKTSPADVEVVGLDHMELDISDAAAVENAIHSIKPDWIINTAAYTDVDKAETEPEQAHQINCSGTANLACTALDTGSRLLHISTDFVFNGRNSRPYKIDDDMDPICQYGKSKAAGEMKILEMNPANSLIFRTSWVYSTSGRNFVKTMLLMMKERDEIRVVSDQVGSPTWSKNLAFALWCAVKSRIPAGIYHWSDCGTASWYDFACAIYDEAKKVNILSGDTRIIPVSTDDYPTAARRPSYSLLDTAATRKTLHLSGEHWIIALRKMLDEYRQPSEVYEK